MPKRLFFLLAAVLTLGAAPPPDPPDPFPGLVARSIGPATMGGRVTSVAVVEKSPRRSTSARPPAACGRPTDDGKTWACVFDGPAATRPSARSPSPRRTRPSSGSAPARPTPATACPGATASSSQPRRRQDLDPRRPRRDAPRRPDRRPSRATRTPPTSPRWATSGGRTPSAACSSPATAARRGGTALKLDADTGAVDLAIDPGDPQTLYAAAYAVRRDAFSGGNPVKQFGAGAGIYRSRDGGTSWQRLAKGLPKRPMGRIGLEVYRKDPRVVFAVDPDRPDRHRQGAGPAAPAGRAGRDGRRVRLARPGRHLAQAQRPVPPAVLLRPDPRRSDRRGARLGAGHPAVRLRRRRQDLPPLARAPASVHVDHHDLWIDPGRPAPPGPRHRRRAVLIAQPGPELDADHEPADQPVLRHRPRHEHAVPHLRRPPGQRQSWGGPSRTDSPLGILNSDWTQASSASTATTAASRPTTRTPSTPRGSTAGCYRYDRRTGNGRLDPARREPPRRAEGALQLEFADRAIAPRLEDDLLRRQLLFESNDRGQTWREISPDLTRRQAGRGVPRRWGTR